MRSSAARVFWLSCLLYAAVGLYLALDVAYFQGDSLSRVAAARSALHSRDPHLAAIGFVFTPLTALLQLPLVALSDWWPALTRWGITAVALSAPFMAGAVTQVHLFARDRGASPWLVWTVTALFALNPMIVYYGANGMSEAPFLMLLCWATRRLVRWISTDDVHDLAVAGIAVGLAYLARYDALAVGAAVTVLVVAVTRWRTGGWRPALLDAILVASPVALSFLVWAATSWLITGEALQQFSSSYGNAAILEQSGGGSAGGLAALAFSVAEILVLGPALPLLAPVVAVLAWRRRDLEPVVPFVVLGAVLAFAALSYFRGMTFPFLRFYLAAVPLAAMWVVQLAPRRGQLRARRLGAHATVRPQDRGSLAPVGALALAVSVPVTFVAMGDANLSQEQHALRTVLFPDPDDTSELRDQENRIIASFGTERRVADYLDDLDLPDGSVVMDTVYGFAVLTATDRPEQFVVPSDADFTRILNDPAENGVRYLLTVPNEGRGVSDAVNRRYPTVFENGADIATLDLEIPNDGDNQPTWRLYRIG